MAKTEIAFYDKAQTDALIDGLVPRDELSEVAFTGSYDSLVDRPTIPTSNDYVDLVSDQNIDGVKNFIDRPTSKVLPDGYQEIDYLEMDNDSPMTTGILLDLDWSDISYCIVKYELLSVVSSSPMFMASHSAGDFYTRAPYVCANGPSAGGLSVANPTSKENLNVPIEFRINRSTATGLIKYGGWWDNLWTAKGRYYFGKFYDPNGDLICHLISCRRVGDGTLGAYDIINDRFYANGGTGQYGAGINVDGTIATVGDIDRAIADIDIPSPITITDNTTYYTMTY